MNKQWMATVAVALMLGLVAFSAPLTAQATAEQDPTQAKFNEEWEALDPEMRDDLKRLIEINGTKINLRRLFEALGAETNEIIEENPGGFKRSDPRLGELLMHHLVRMNNMLAENYDEFLLPMTVAYSRHYTHEEVKDLIAFYESPIGQKELETIPKVMAESIGGVMPIMRKRIERLNGQLKEELDAFNILAVGGQAEAEVGRLVPPHSEVQAVVALIVIGSCAGSYAMVHPNKGFPNDLADMGPAGENCLKVRSESIPGYRLEYSPTKIVGGVNTGFNVIAVPVQSGDGARRSYFTDDSYVIRFTEETRPATVNDPPLREPVFVLQIKSNG